ncbi:NADPH:quinone reductase [Actinoplanes lobatus]|uniref:NADPH:quinone reductase n=1 Tax=Actinoplanes lobatus TaxID=113568 RepID=A0A7W7HIP4_9ACTN|nr:NADP-dependent oxidoreductase [Actinoplanes lobatus]MBB4751251.1 NADPH:quinone reductase-like Zn-dependent oxidoreductase [Actinoplanes lobatus]GGN97536.1 NADPH:quinone reductase [Actinoplanes lobatus]GIE44217.1 NADPH:quinone reductase [Actinoplanes lobatus]
MSRAVSFTRFGGTDVLEVITAEPGDPGEGEVLVEVRAAGLNPVESAIRGGFLEAVYPTTFPARQGKDVAGVVRFVGAGVTGFADGDEVIGLTSVPGTHAEHVIVPAAQLAARPAGVGWEVAGALPTAGAAAYAAVHAVAPVSGDTVVVANAAGGVGSLATQLARFTGAIVIGLAGPAHHDWLRDHGIVPVAYGDGVEQRIKETSGGRVDAFIDAFGAPYVELALSLGVRPERINTLADFTAAREHGVHARGSNHVSVPEVLADLAALHARGDLDIPVEAVYPLDRVADAYRHLERRHTLGKVVLTP